MILGQSAWVGPGDEAMVMLRIATAYRMLVTPSTILAITLSCNDKCKVMKYYLPSLAAESKTAKTFDYLHTNDYVEQLRGKGKKKRAYTIDIYGIHPKK